MARVVEVALHGRGCIRLTADRYDLRVDDEGHVVLIVGKTEHVTRWTDPKRLRAAIDGKRERAAKREEP